MCEYCDDARQTLADDTFGGEDGVEIELSFEGGEPEILATGYYDGGYICGCTLLKVNYCPMCGRDLRGDA